MRSVGIQILKNRLSEYIRLPSQGETVLVTDRDRVVAEITAPKPGRTESVSDAILAEAVRKGWLTPPVARRVPAERRPWHPSNRLSRSSRTSEGTVDLRRYLGDSGRAFAEDHHPSADFWEQDLVSSRLLEYETWSSVHRRQMSESHGDAARQLIESMAIAELSREVLRSGPRTLSARGQDARCTASLHDRFSSGSGDRNRTGNLRPSDVRGCRDDAHPAQVTLTHRAPAVCQLISVNCRRAPGAVRR